MQYMYIYICSFRAKKKCLIEEVFSGVTFSNVQLDLHLNVFLCNQYVVYVVCVFKFVCFLEFSKHVSTVDCES